MVPGDGAASLRAVWATNVLRTAGIDALVIAYLFWESDFFVAAP